MPPPGSRSSLRRLADRLGLSVAAVSMALRGHPRISAATAARVQALAHKLGYRTNPLLRSVMSHVRSGGVRNVWQNVAFVWLEASPEVARTGLFEQQTIRSIRRRADQLGLHLDEFFLAQPGMNPRR